MSARTFAGGAALTTLSGGINNSTTSVVVVDASTWPATGAFSVVLDRGQSTEEKILVASRSGNTLTVTRAYDGTTASAHAASANAECCGTAIDFQEANDHIQATTGHGATGAVVGTTNSQTLTNKTLTSPTINNGTTNLASGTLVLPQGATPAQTAEGSAFWDTDDNLLSVGDGSSRKTMVDLDSTQTLTGKTLTSPVLTGPTITGTATLTSGALLLPATAAPAETADGSVVWDSDDNLLTVGTGAGRKTYVDLDTAQTLTNKTITGLKQIVTSSTRPGSPTDGLEIYETDTQRSLQYHAATPDGGDLAAGWWITASPRSERSSAITSSSASTSGTTELALVAFSGDFPIGKVVLAFSWYNINFTVATDAFLIRFYDTNGSVLISEHLITTGGSSTVVGRGTVETEWSPSGVGTAQVVLVRSSGTGTAALSASSTRKATLSSRLIPYANV